MKNQFQRIVYKYKREIEYLKKPPFRFFILGSLLILIIVFRWEPSATLPIAGILVALLPLYWQMIETRDDVMKKVSLGTTLDIYDSIRTFPDDYAYATIKKVGSHNICPNPGHLREVRIVDGPIGEVAIYDGEGENAQEIVPPCFPNKGQVLKKNCSFYTGLVIVTKENTKIVISYRC